MKRMLGLTCLIGLFAHPGVLQAAAPAGWHDRCFGNESVGGTVVTDLGGGAFDLTVTGAGTDIWGKSDTGRFVFLPLAGDCEIMATVDVLPQEELYGEWARFGLMMRGSLMNNTVNTTLCRVKGTAATAGRLKLTQRPSHNADTANWPGVTDTSVTNLTGSVRLRLVRQGDTYTAWLSTNSPAYDAWARVASHTTVFHGAMNVGVFVSRWQDLGPDTLTRTFGNVVARPLVAASTNASDGVTVSWIGDSALTNGTVIGYAVSRAAGPSGTFAALGETAAGVTTYDDASAGLGTSYVYRVHAYVDEGPVTNSVLVGTSVNVRRAVVSANPSPAALKGVYAEYYKPRTPGTLVAARVDPNIDNSWNYSGTSVYPVNTPNGLSSLDEFRTVYAGSLIPTESGCYGLVERADDGFYMWVDGVQVVDQGAYQNNNEIHTTPVWLEAGRSYPVRVEHYEGGGGENAILRWFKGTEAIATVPQAYFEPFPWPWQHRDVGDSPRFGNAVYDSSAYSFTVTSGGLGVDPATGRDDAHVVWQTASTDFDVIARVASLTGPAQPGMGAGLTVRGSLADNAASFSMVVIAEGETGTERALGLAYRATAGGVTVTSDESIPLPETPAELRLARRGTNVWAYYRTASSGGWVGVTNIGTQFSGTLYAGMMAFSGDLTQTATGVFDTVTFAYPQNNTFYAAVANHEATLSVSNVPPMQARQANDALANVRYYWADALSGNVGSYTVFRSDRPDQNFSVVGQAVPVGAGFAYVDPLPATNTLYFYRMETAYDLGALASGGSNDLVITTGVYGVSDGSFAGSGQGLFAAFHRAPVPETFYTNRPAHTMVRNLNSWEKGTYPNDTNPIVAASVSDDGLQVGPDNFQATWAGWVVPQYTGYHWFRTQTDDAISVWLGGKRIIYYWDYTATAQTSAAVWLEAGKRVPIHVYFQQGTGGGYFRMWWMHGLGLDGGYVTIPSAQLETDIPDGTPIAVAPGSADEFGPWRNIDINTGKPGYAALGGTPEAFDCTITAGGADIWDNADGLHFVYQEIAENFEMEATFNSILTESDPWAKVGLMVRDGTGAGARNMCLIVSRSNGYRIQLRSAADGTSASLAPPEIPNSGTAAATTPVTLKLVRERGKIKAYINGTHATYTGGIDIDVSGWSENLCVGVAMTAHNNGRLTSCLVTDVTFKVVYPKGSVLLLR